MSSTVTDSHPEHQQVPVTRAGEGVVSIGEQPLGVALGRVLMDPAATRTLRAEAHRAWVPVDEAIARHERAQGRDL